MTANNEGKSEAPAKQGFDPRKWVDSGAPPGRGTIPFAIVQNFSKPKIKPVPGVPPHLWHRHQGRHVIIKDPTGKVLDLSKTKTPSTPGQSVKQQPRGQSDVPSSPGGPKESVWEKTPQADSSRMSTRESASQTGWGARATETGQSAGAGSQNSNTCLHTLKGDQAVVHHGNASANPWAAKKKPWQAEKKLWIAEKKPRATGKRGSGAEPPWWTGLPSKDHRPPPAPADYMEHELPARRFDYSGSQRSPLSVSDFHLSDDPEEVKEASSKMSHDIRNEIGVEVPMHRFNDEMGRPKIRFGHFYERVNYDEGLHTEEYNRDLVEAWIQNITVSAKASFKSRRDHFNCDINPETGYFLAPLSHPETRASEAQDPELFWRQMNWSSEILRRRKLTHPRGDRFNRGEVPPWGRQPPSGQLNVNIADLNVPQVPCHLRPAEAPDMEAVASIYNSEAIQKLDSAPLEASDFEKILTDTHGHEYPFIVAVSGSARMDALKDGIRFESSQSQQNVLPPGFKEGEVLGFAYLSVWKPGLAGSYAGTSRATVEAHVYVHTSWRRKKIGSALLDRLLWSVSLNAKSKDMCDFWDPSRKPAYAAPCQHERYTLKIYLQYLVRTKFSINDGVWEAQENQSGDIAWVKNLLETNFGFKEKVRFEAAYRSPKVEGGGANHWLDAVVFEHTCCSPSWIDLLY